MALTSSRRVPPELVSAARTPRARRLRVLFSAISCSTAKFSSR